MSNLVKPARIKDGVRPSLAEKSRMVIVAAEALIGAAKARAAIPASNNSLLFMVSSRI
jgi:DNA polymerase III psi subunit